jgi:EAL domain-containing protein (putative c-di-GMP-specific phosphodiesterase class I)
LILLNDVHVSLSIGIARHPADGADAEELLAHGQLKLYYQPKFDIATGEVRSVEALLRWNHPLRGSVAPGEFVPIAEETGLILPIGEWVIREACRQARAWQLSGMTFLRVAVNVSPLQFHQSNLLALIREALGEFSLDPSYLELELTETTLMTQVERTAQILERLSTMGVLVTIDDFGTGYSSMSYLRRFPIDKLKIDRSFIRDLTANADDASIVRATISLAHALRLKVVAEGVETAAQLDMLRQMGCDQYQGFHRSPAVQAGEVERIVRDAQAQLRPLTETAAMRTHSRLTRLVR